MASVALPEMARIGFYNQTLHQISMLNHVRQPALHNAG
jgi:hypothetical protein